MLIQVTLIAGSRTSAAETDELLYDDADRLLAELDILCRDSWCEGHFWIDFNYLSCSFDQEECELEFSFSRWNYSWSGDPDFVEPIEGSYDAACIIEASSTDDLYDDGHPGNPTMYLIRTINNCTERAMPGAAEYFRELAQSQ